MDLYPGDPSRPMAQAMAARRGADWSAKLREWYRAPWKRNTTDRLAQLMIDLRAAGFDVEASVRAAREGIADLGVDVDVPVRRRLRRVR